MSFFYICGVSSLDQSARRGIARPQMLCRRVQDQQVLLALRSAGQWNRNKPLRRQVITMVQVCMSSAQTAGNGCFRTSQPHSFLHLSRTRQFGTDQLRNFQEVLLKPAKRSWAHRPASGARRQPERSVKCIVLRYEVTRGGLAVHCWWNWVRKEMADIDAASSCDVATSWRNST